MSLLQLNGVNINWSHWSWPPGERKKELTSSSSLPHFWKFYGNFSREKREPRQRASGPGLAGLRARSTARLLSLKAAKNSNKAGSRYTTSTQREAELVFYTYAHERRKKSELPSAGRRRREGKKVFFFLLFFCSLVRPNAGTVAQWFCSRD